MNVKQAVLAAKDYIIDILGDEGIEDLGLEEIEMDEEGHWQITIGFTRPWDRKVGSVLAGSSSRSYKVLVVRDCDRRVLSVKNRDVLKKS